MIRKLLLAIALVVPIVATPAVAKISGDVQSIPATPAAYTVIVFPKHHEADQLSQQWIEAMSTDPTLVALRQSTQVQEYDATNPDFKHRWADRLNEVREGQVAFLVIQGGTNKLLYGKAGASPADVVSELRSQGVLETIRLSAVIGEGCINCRPRIFNHPSDPDEDECRPRHPRKDEDEDREPILRPIKQILSPAPAPHFDPIAPQPDNSLIAAVGLGAAGLVLFPLVSGLTYIAARKKDERDDD